MVKPVKVSIVNGDLKFAQNPVAVGHYTNDVITSAESRLNSCLSDRLKHRYRLGLYPGALETTEIFLNPDERSRPKGAIVLGLGKIGELTPRGLEKSFARAALSYALTVSETTFPHFQKNDGGSRLAAITSLLIGTGAGGISVRDSITSILRGVAHANQMLQNTGYIEKVVLDCVEFLELWEDLALQVADCMGDIKQDPELYGLFDFSETAIKQASGARVRIAFKEPEKWLKRLRILGDTDGSLRFSVMTARARTEVSLVATQRALVDQFIKSAIRNPAREYGAGKTLFELLVPNSLKGQISDRKDLVLILNEESAQYPWELMEDKLSNCGRPLAVEASVVRQLETAVYREEPLTTTSRKALVIGDPKSDQTPLPSAQQEAQLVRQLLLENNYIVETRIGTAAQDIVEILFKDTYRILHLTGHGVYRRKLADSTDKFISGMVIGENIFLTPADIRQMRQIPELVFINCCHLGRIEGEPKSEHSDYNQLAANLAAQFIRMGVRAVIAAGWAVDDVAASTFACRFYKQMLKGDTFGRSVQLARGETYEKHSGFDTWGAYQCYGDPSYGLMVRTSRETTSDHIQHRFYVQREAVLEIKNLIVDAKLARSEGRTKLYKKFQQLIKKIPDEWLKLASIQVALGKAYEKFDLLEEAIIHYQAALDIEYAEVPISVIESMANMKGVLGIHQWKNRKSSNREDKAPKDATAEVNRAITMLEQLLNLGKTAQRYILLGNAFKRKARITADKEQLMALEQMQNNFQKAVTQKRQSNENEEIYYAKLNCLTAEFILGLKRGNLDDKLISKLTKQIIKVEDLSTAIDQQMNDFRSIVAVSECRLIRQLFEGSIEQYSEETLQRFNQAVSYEIDQNRMNLVLEDIDFIVEMLSTCTNLKYSGGSSITALTNIQKNLRILTNS